MTQLPRITVDLTEARVSHSDPQEPLPSTMVNLPGLGDIAIHQAAFAYIADRTIQGSCRIEIVVGRAGCRCGCGAPGLAFASTPSVDEARMLAAELNKIADAHEAAAAAAAASALKKAASR